MAEAAKKQEPQALQEAKRSDASRETVPPKKKDRLGILVLSLVTLNLVAIGALGFFMKKMWAHIKSLQGQVQVIAQPKEEIIEEKNLLGKRLEPQPLGTLIPLDSFLVNINSDQGAKFLQIQLELELADPGVEEEISRKKPAVRDAIILLLSSRAYTELREPDGIKKLRKDILAGVNHLLSAGKVKEVYFTQFHFN